MNIVYIIVMSLLLLLYAYLAVYMFRLEKMGCKCSEGWERMAIQTYFVFLIVLIISMAVFDPPPWLLHVASIVNILGMIIIFFYIRRLKTEKCECSEDTARDVMEIFNYVQIIMFGITFLIVVLAGMGLIKSKGALKIKGKRK